MDAKDLQHRSLEDLLELYLARFDQQFPMMLCRTMEEEKIKEIIVDSIVRGRPWEPRLIKGAIY